MDGLYESIQVLIKFIEGNFEITDVDTAHEYLLI